MTVSREPSRLRILAGLAVLIAGIVGLHLAGRLGLRGPDGLDRDALSAWFDDPLTVAATVTRWLCLLLAYYLLAVIVLVRLTGGRTSIGGVSVVPSYATHVVGLVLGLGAVAIPLAQHLDSTDTPAAGDSPRPLTMTDVALDEAPVLTEVPVIDDVARPGPTGLVNAADSAAAPSRPDTQPAIDEITVAAGEHLWSISEERLEEAWGRTDLADAHIVPYWRSVIEANRDRLVDRDNPDLILPGQVLVLPDPPDDPAIADDRSG